MKNIIFSQTILFHDTDLHQCHIHNPPSLFQRMGTCFNYWVLSINDNDNGLQDLLFQVKLSYLIIPIPIHLLFILFQAY